MAERKVYPKDCDFAVAFVRCLVRNALARPEAAEALRQGRHYLRGWVVGRVAVQSGCDFDYVEALAAPMVEIWRKASPEERLVFEEVGQPIQYREKGGPRCGGSG